MRLVPRIFSAINYMMRSPTTNGSKRIFTSRKKSFIRRLSCPQLVQTPVSILSLLEKRNHPCSHVRIEIDQFRVQQMEKVQKRMSNKRKLVDQLQQETALICGNNIPAKRQRKLKVRGDWYSNSNITKWILTTVHHWISILPFTNAPLFFFSDDLDILSHLHLLKIVGFILVFLRTYEITSLFASSINLDDTVSCHCFFGES